MHSSKRMGWFQKSTQEMDQMCFFHAKRWPRDDETLFCLISASFHQSFSLQSVRVLFCLLALAFSAPINGKHFDILSFWVCLPPVGKITLFHLKLAYKRTRYTTKCTNRWQKYWHTPFLGLHASSRKDNSFSSQVSTQALQVHNQMPNLT